MKDIIAMVAKRLGLGLLTIIVISLLIFVGIEALPGDLATAILGQNALPETVAAFREELKLDLAPHVRYFAWLGDFMKGDLGNSLANSRPVADLIGWRFANTMFLASTAAVISVPLAILLGLLAALYRDSWFDNAISTSTLSAISFPEFFIAYILIVLAEDTCNYSSQPDAYVYRNRSHDAPDACSNHQCSGQLVYRNGPFKRFETHAGHRCACISQCVVAGY
jgi:peptide/nickel transport system permease protein